MKILYFDCAMGAAGDMLAASLYELLEDRESFVLELRSLNIPGVEFEISKTSKNGVSGSYFNVKINGKSEEEHHCHGHSMHDIEHIVSAMNTSEKIKKDILNIYNVIAEAESKVHGKSVKEIHFHEVGMLDAVSDIAAVCILMNKLSPERVYASPIHVGAGQVKCAHGILPVPAPATAEILKGVPIYSGETQGELCTPTGAALLKYFVDEFGKMPTLSVEKMGYGMGKKNFDAINCIRAFIGTSEKDNDTFELCANIDDMSSEDIAFAAEKLMSEGALDVWFENIGMKKNRPGIKLCVLCKADAEEKLSELIFKHTTTIGIRRFVCERRVLSRRSEDVCTKFGVVKKKISEGYGVVREKYEFEDIARIARENEFAVSEVKQMLE